MTTTKSTTIRRMISLFMALFMLAFAITASATTASAACRYKQTTTITGRVNAKKADCITVYTNGKAAKLRICTFSQNGKRTSGKLTVYATTDNGNHYSWSIKGCNSCLSSTTNLTLPKGNTRYNVYIYRGSKTQKNITNTFYLSVDFKKNCWHYYN